MTVLQELLTWSQTRPDWQRDALRRLVQTAQLTGADIDALMELCKTPYGLQTIKVTPVPLSDEHRPAPATLAPAVTLKSLTHKENVNALAANQILPFGPSLTIIYGDNGSGKSGYTRILKLACRARAAETILANVLTETLAGTPTAIIRFAVGDKEEDFAWPDKTPSPAALSRISVFDAQSAGVYLRDKTEVAYRPLGLDLFDKIVKLCEGLRAKLTKERDGLPRQELPRLPDGTKAQQAVANITSMTSPEHITNIAMLSAAEEARIAVLKQQLHEHAAQDATKTITALNTRAQRCEQLKTHLTTIASRISQSSAQTISAAWNALQVAQKSADDAQKTAFPKDTLKGTGDAAWRAIVECRGNLLRSRIPGSDVSDTA